MVDFFQEVEDLTKNLVGIPSVNTAPGQETAIAGYIHQYYAELEYFKNYPERNILQPTTGDLLERHNAISYIKGTKQGGSDQTIILLGHIDTVGIEDFRDFSDYATKPDQLPAILKEHFSLSQEVLDDIESGRYMFGRGALDMKAGVAGHMVLMKHFSRHPEQLCGNLIAIHECDEESGSKGILSALDLLVELSEREGFDYIAAINADYSTNHTPDDQNVYVYHGSIGKLLPTISVFGKEAHVGQSFAAFDPNLLIAMVTRQVSLNPIMSDQAKGETTLPPISLKQADQKEKYTVQTALNALAYYNVFSHGRTPSEVLDLFRDQVIIAYDETIELLQQRYDAYCQMAGIEQSQLPWKTRVYTWEELAEELTEQSSEFPKELEKFKHDLHEKDRAMDMRMFSHEVVKFAWKKRADTSPGLVIHFGGIYNARVETMPESDNDKRLLDSVAQAIESIQPQAKRSIKTRLFYPYISDASFLAVSDDVASLKRLELNMPSYGTKYIHELDKILQIDVPIVNIGTFGKDGHMLTERVDKWHSFQNVPNISYQTILKLLD